MDVRGRKRTSEYADGGHREEKSTIRLKTVSHHMTAEKEGRQKNRRVYGKERKRRRDGERESRREKERERERETEKKKIAI